MCGFCRTVLQSILLLIGWPACGFGLGPPLAGFLPGAEPGFTAGLVRASAPPEALTATALLLTICCGVWLPSVNSMSALAWLGELTTTREPRAIVYASTKLGVSMSWLCASLATG